MDGRPWVCEKCKNIGPRAVAIRHMARTGHWVKPLPPEAEREVRAAWREEGRAE